LLVKPALVKDAKELSGVIAKDGDIKKTRVGTPAPTEKKLLI